jgi:hypothetical protein
VRPSLNHDESRKASFPDDLCGISGMNTYILLSFFFCIAHKESSAVNMKPLELSSSLSSRTPPAVPRKSISDNEFENKLNHSRRSTDPINLVTYSSSDLQAATGNFHSSRLLGQGTIGGVYKAKYTDGRVRSYHASLNPWRRNMFASMTQILFCIQNFKFYVLYYVHICFKLLISYSQQY